MNYKLKKDGWHFKLQQWTFGNNIERMGNMCPYFWLTNFCIVTSPFVLLWKSFIKLVDVVSAPFSLINNYWSERYRRKTIAYAGELSNEQAFNLFMSIYKWYSFYNETLSNIYTSHKFDGQSKKAQNKVLVIFEEWKNQNKNLWYKIIHKERKYFIDASELEKKAKADRKKLLYTIADKTKLLMILPLGTILIYLSYYFGIGVILFFEDPVLYLTIFGIVIFIVLCMLGSIFLIMKAEETKFMQKHISPIFKPVGKYIFMPIGSVFMFFAINIKLLYKNYCPQINWEN